MNISADQYRELEKNARSAQPAHVRIKALALVNLADGRSIREVSEITRVSRQSLYLWRRRYLEEGVKGLYVRAGRGRKPAADLKEIEQYLRQSPRQFGLRQTRWTLSSLAEVVPSLKGFTPFGVQQALFRAGFHYKRGQPRLHSPDPLYEEKKGLWTRR